MWCRFLRWLCVCPQDAKWLKNDALRSAQIFASAKACALYPQFFCGYKLHACLVMLHVKKQFFQPFLLWGIMFNPYGSHTYKVIIKNKKSGRTSRIVTFRAKSEVVAQMKAQQLLHSSEECIRGGAIPDLTWPRPAAGWTAANLCSHSLRERESTGFRELHVKKQFFNLLKKRDYEYIFNRRYK